MGTIIVDGEPVEVAAGLTAGDQVILDPPRELEDGSPVKIR